MLPSAVSKTVTSNKQPIMGCRERKNQTRYTKHGTNTTEEKKLQRLRNRRMNIGKETNTTEQGGKGGEEAKKTSATL